ncbi:MAG: hypothetical protein AAF585_21420, partial [Verrucomicrobiota bacterium]
EQVRNLIRGMESEKPEKGVSFREASYRKSYDDWWMANEMVLFGDESTNIAIESKGGPPSEFEFEILDKIYGLEPKIRAEVQDSVYQRYQEIRDAELEKVSRELGAATANLIFPVISSSEDIWRIAAYSVVELPIQKDQEFRFRILLLCNWDLENGLQIRYIEGESQGLEKGEH